MPWVPQPPTIGQRLARNAMITAAMPVVVGAVAVDTATAPLVRRRWSNTYRIIARYDGAPEDATPR